MDPWTTLELSRGAPLSEARAAWRAAARRHHPDVGGDAAKFRAARAAWEAIRSTLATDRPDRCAPAPEPWTHARAVRHLVELDDVEIESFDDGTTGIAGVGGVAWLSDEELEWDDVPVPWSVMDDRIMEDLIELLLGVADAA